MVVSRAADGTGLQCAIALAAQAGDGRLARGRGAGDTSRRVQYKGEVVGAASVI